MIWIRTIVGHILFYVGILGIIVGIIAASDLELFGLTADLAAITKLVVLSSVKYAALGFVLVLVGRILIPTERVGAGQEKTYGE